MKKVVGSPFFQIKVIGLGLVFGIYFSFKVNNDHKNIDGVLDHHATMDHSIIDISNDSIIPEIQQVKVSKDVMSGWNLFIKTKNFRFSPEKINTKHVPGYMPICTSMEKKMPGFIQIGFIFLKPIPVLKN